MGVFLLKILFGNYLQSITLAILFLKTNYKNV